MTKKLPLQYRKMAACKEGKKKSDVRRRSIGWMGDIAMNDQLVELQRGKDFSSLCYYASFHACDFYRLFDV